MSDLKINKYRWKFLKELTWWAGFCLIVFLLVYPFSNTSISCEKGDTDCYKIANKLVDAKTKSLECEK